MLPTNRRTFLRLSGGAFLAGGTAVAGAGQRPEGDPSPPVDEGWPMYRGGPGHAGAATWTTGPDGPPDVEWTYESCWSDPVELAEPSVLDGTVYVAETRYAEDAHPSDRVRGGRVTALDATDGTERWAYELGCAGFGTTPAVRGETVYVADTGGTVRALETATGEERWARELGTSSHSYPTPVDGVVYVSGDGTYALDADDGSTVWTSDGLYNPSVAGDLVVGSDLRDDEVHLVAADAATGEEAWATDLPRADAGGDALPPMVRGSVVLGEKGGPATVHGVAVGDGTPLWADEGSDGVRPALDGERAYIASNVGPPVHAHDAESGAELWTTEKFEATGLTVAGDVLYVERGFSPGERSLEALDAADGTERWRLELPVDALAVAGGAAYATAGGTLRVLR